jgi:lantibiotic modifying enzyme
MKIETDYYSALSKIIHQAYSFSELLNQRLSQNSFSENQVSVNPKIDQVNSKIDQWCQLIARGDWQQFEKRLTWDGLDINMVRQCFASVDIKDKQDFPEWAKTLNECLKAHHNLENTNELIARRSQFVDSKNLFPYEEILPPFVYVARKKIISRLGLSNNLLLEEAYFDLERSITKRLVRLIIPLMEQKFSCFLAIKQSSFIRYLKKGSYDNFQLYYQEFIKNQQKEDLLNLFVEYPVLARLLGTSINLWLDSNVELISRLASDWTEIQSTFQPQTELGQVIAIQTDLSDLHEDNRSVTIITFSSGLKVVYKPKNLDLEEAYINLLEYFNKLGVFLPFKIFKLVKRPNYGWVEFIETLPCKNEEQTKRYYQRAGVLLWCDSLLAESR